MSRTTVTPEPDTEALDTAELIRKMNEGR